MQNPHWSAWWVENDSLQRRQCAVRGQRLHRLDRAPVCLHCEHAAASDCGAVHADGARAADPVLATHVRPREPEPVAQEVREEEPRLDGLAHCPTVDGELDLDHDVLRIARSASTRVSLLT